MKSYHTLEIPFAFANVDLAKTMTGTGEDRYALQDRMSEAWANFARTGNPSQPGLVWTPSDATRCQTMVFDNRCRMMDDPEGDLRSIWEHTRLEAIRYVTMVPGRQNALLLEPARQADMLDAFLRLQPHDKTVIDFTGVAAGARGQPARPGSFSLSLLHFCGDNPRDANKPPAGGLRALVQCGTKKHASNPPSC